MRVDWVPKPSPMLVVKSVSGVPSAFNRAMRLLIAPSTNLKSPTTMIFPSDCTAMPRVSVEKPVPTFAAKSVSKEPSELKRAM